MKLLWWRRSKEVRPSSAGGKPVECDPYEYARSAVAVWFKRLAIGPQRKHPPRVVTDWKEWEALSDYPVERWAWGLCDWTHNRIWIDVERIGSRYNIYNTALHEVIHLVYRQARDEDQVEALQHHWLKRMEKMRAARKAKEAERTGRDPDEIANEFLPNALRELEEETKLS
jgi:hypothetical protein